MDAPDHEDLARRVGRTDAMDDDRAPEDRVADRRAIGAAAEGEER
jgi:hypothetical protein